jgi:hypothetical protein
MSGDSTNECCRYRCAGSRGSSMRKDPAVFESVPFTLTFPLK